MLRIHYTPRADEDCAELRVTDAQFKALHEKIKEVAADTSLAWAIPFIVLDGDSTLYQARAGDYKANYTFSATDLWVLSIFV